MAPSLRMTSIAILLVMLPNATDCYAKPYHLRLFDMYMSGEAAPTCITLFRNHSHQGPGTVECQSRARVSVDTKSYELGSNDKIRSVRLGPGVDRVVLYQHSHWRQYGVRFYLYATNASWLGGYFSVETSSFEVIPRVRAGCVMVFVDTHYRGWRKTICRNEPLFGFEWKDAISSIVVSRETYGLLYPHHGYQGNHVLVTDDVPDLGTFDMNNEISSISFNYFELDVMDA